MCVCACEEGCLPFNVVCKKKRAASTRNTLHTYACVFVCKWVGPFTHTHETKFVLWPQRCHSQQCSRQKKGAACCCNCSKKTGNAPTQTAVNVCLYVCRHIYLHMYCTYVHTYIHMYVHMYDTCNLNAHIDFLSLIFAKWLFIALPALLLFVIAVIVH